MNYQEFLEYIVENLPELMNVRGLEQRAKMAEKTNEEDGVAEEVEICYEAHLHTITKNNGIVLDGITLLNKGESAGPNIYLNSYFENYQMGKPLNSIMNEIIDCYLRAKEETTIEVEDVLDFEAVKNKIVVRLVNYEKNKEQLTHCPHKRFEDLAITFRYLAAKDAMGLASSLIFDKEFERWGIELDDLYQLALCNTMREFPWQMDSLVKVVSECFGERLPEELRDEFMHDVHSLEEMENNVSIFVLTNDVGVNGATCILYDDVIKNFAKVQGCNIYILPSSVHEVMLVPENADTEPEFLKELVVEANQSAVGLIDLLSDHIYYYDMDSEQIRMCE